MQTSTYIQKVWKNFLDLLFPIKYDLNFINNLSVEKFLSLTKPALNLPIANTLSVVSYKNKLVKKAIHSLKFENNQQIAGLFAEIIYENLIEELSNLKFTSNFDKPILVVIPLHKKKQKERGYNQVDLIAKKIIQIGQNNPLEYKVEVLKKIRNTHSQSRTKNKEERLKNLKGCFKIKNPESVRNQNIILLDDVTTTGATLTEAVRTLKLAQPKNIICITLAH